MAGSGETEEGKGDYRNTIVRLGETSPDALREKMRFVVDAMDARLKALGFDWPAVTRTDVYTIHDAGGAGRGRTGRCSVFLLGGSPGITADLPSSTSSSRWISAVRCEKSWLQVVPSAAAFNAAMSSFLHGEHRFDRCLARSGSGSTKRSKSVCGTTRYETPNGSFSQPH
ncbi:MAG: hypothetical protein R2843_09825 [Thermomicrobiales bacterium]